MAVYRLTDRKFSRLWRRNKKYSDVEIRYLARKRGLESDARKGVITVTDPKNKKVVATFQQVAEAGVAAVSERTSLFAALRSA